MFRLIRPSRFRAGLVAGLATGYYLGTKAGRERYEQIRAGIDRLRSGQVGGEARGGPPPIV
jgi:hypothetical protein